LLVDIASGKPLGGVRGPPAAAVQLEQVAVVHHAIEDRGPVVDRSVRGDDGEGLLVATHQHVGEFVAGGLRQAAQEQIIDNEQIGTAQLREQSGAIAECARRVQILEQHVGQQISSTTLRASRKRSVPSSSASRLGTFGL
jgi:hypothetical protein